jgi:hypothetical protein
VAGFVGLHTKSGIFPFNFGSHDESVQLAEFLEITPGGSGLLLVRRLDVSVCFLGVGAPEVVANRTSGRHRNDSPELPPLRCSNAIGRSFFLTLREVVQGHAP